ncbi:MAG: HEAT repeat domain-containing protein [Fimbriiglobus sp.]|nr:HEAT repeat domain-containing protein [Fimbriiglobus sp.]
MTHHLSTALLTLLLAALAVAAPPSDPPAEFAQPQSPPKPAPFEVKYVDAGTTDPRLKGLMAPEGFKVELVADAPVVINPVAMTFAPDGTLFVAEWVPDAGREWYEFKETFRFRDGTTKAVATMKKFAPDVVKVLRRNKDGVYDKAEVIFTDELPSTLLYHDGWLYTASRGTVRRYRQSQSGGKWDLRETIAQGFCGFHHHQVSGLTIGPDGWLYITSGDDDNFAEGSDGSRATVLRTGAVFRCQPDGSRMETFSLGYRNPYRDLALDAKLNWFHADNDNEDGSRFTGCRLVHVAEDVDYGWRLFEGARCCRPDHVRGAVAGERPGKLQPMLKTGRGSPAGVMFYDDRQLPEQYQGLMYYPDVFRRVVRAYTIAPVGSTFAVTHEFEFLKSDDPLYRPCQMVVGPDGAVYVLDWRTDSGGAGKLWGDGKHGRIYRMTWAGTEKAPAIPPRPMDTWAVWASAYAPLDNLKKGFLHGDTTTRRLAQIELVRRGTKEVQAVREFFEAVAADEKAAVTARLLAIGGLQQVGDADSRKGLLALLTDKDADVRRMVCDALARTATVDDFAVAEALAKRLTDESPVVRRAAVLAVGRLGAGGAADALLTAWKTDDGKDAFLADAYLRALERLGKKGIDALLAVAQSGDDATLHRVAAGFTALRTRPAFDALPQLLANPHLKGAEKAELVRSYLNYQFDPSPSLDPLAKFLTARPDEPAEVKKAGLEVLGMSNGMGGGPGGEFVIGLLDASEEDVRLAALTAIEKGRLLTAAAKVKEMAADTAKPIGERAAAVRAGRVVGGPEFAAAVRGFLANDKESAGFKVEALRALAGMDAPAARTFAEKFLDQPDPTLIAESVAVLGATKEGAKLVGERYLAKKLPRDLFPRVSDALRKYPNDAEVAKLNAEVMRGGLLLSLEPDQVEKVRAKVLKDGDPKRGKAIYMNTAAVACGTCHKMEGVGGQVGPDLTRIWDTMTVEKLLETIIAPSKEIKEGYQTYQANTLDGQTITGLKVSDTKDEVILREATGRDVKIARKDLDKLAASKLSLMPDNVVSQLSHDQFIDLIAFLKSRKEQESLRGLVVSVTLQTGLPKDLKATHPAETNPAADGKWVPLVADPSGLFALKPTLPAEPTGAVVVAYVYSTKKQTAAVSLLADDAVRVTVGGKVVFTREGPKATKFEDAEKFTAELEPGWTPVVVRLSTVGPTHRLGLQFTGDDLRTAAKAEK